MAVQPTTAAPAPTSTPPIPGSAHYQRDYITGLRMHSYAEQVGLVHEATPETCLEVGPGPGIVTLALRQSGVAVTTLDVQPELAPTIVGDVRAIPAEDRSFDVAICGQVLEHLPWSDFPSAVDELRRVTRTRLVLSLPDLTRHVGVRTHLPVVGPRSFSVAPPAPRTDQAWRTARFVELGHYWEIGLDGIRWTSVRDVLRSAGFRRVRTHRLTGLPWHRFFVAE